MSPCLRSSGWIHAGSAMNCEVQQQTRQKLRAFSPYGCERNRKYQRHELGIHADRNGVNTLILQKLDTLVLQNVSFRMQIFEKC